MPIARSVATRNLGLARSSKLLNTACPFILGDILVLLMDLSLESLEKAISLRKRIHKLETELNALFSTRRGQPGQRGFQRKRMSPAARAKIAAAARARWAKQKRSKPGISRTRTARKKGISAAGRRKLSQLMKARWAAKKKAAGKK